MSYLAKTTAKGHDYFKVLESYRDELGVTKHRLVYNIGPTKELFRLLPDYVRNGKSPPPENQPAIEGASEETRLTVLPVRTREHGASSLLWSVSEWLGVRDLIDTIMSPGSDHDVPRSISLVLGGIHRAFGPESKNQFANWFSHTSLPDLPFFQDYSPDIFTSGHFYEQMEDVTIAEIQAFETALFKQIVLQFPEIESALQTASIDFTNYFTYITVREPECDLAQYGHSKEGRSGQRIFSVAVVTTPLLGIPIATMVYPGNLNDKTALATFIENIKTRLSAIIPMEKLTFVFDGGGASEDVLDQVPGSFITRGSLKAAPELYDVPLSDYETIQLSDGSIVKAYRTTAKQYGKERTVIITLSDELKDGQVKELDKQFAKFEEGLADVNKMLANPPATSDKRKEAIADRVTRLMPEAYHMTEFITITYETVEAKDPVLQAKFKKLLKKSRSGTGKGGKKRKSDAPLDEPLVIDGVEMRSVDDAPLCKIVTKVECQVNAEKKQAVIDKYYGKHMLTTDHNDWSTERTLDTYRDQEFIEGWFKDTKDTDHFTVRPVYHWISRTIRTHVMMCYLGLTLCRVAQYMLRTMYGYKITCSKLIDLLMHVQECTVTVEINGERLNSQKTINELNEQEQIAWDHAKKLITYMKKHPAKKLTVETIMKIMEASKKAVAKSEATDNDDNCTGQSTAGKESKRGE